MRVDAEALVRSVTRPTRVPLVPELELHLLSPSHPLWHATPEEAAARGLEMPYWAFAWPGGQALARYVLDQPEVVRGKRVLDLGAGGALEGLAALRSGARAVRCADVDPLAGVAATLNARLNGLVLETTSDDLLSCEGAALDCEAVLVGDLTFDEAIVARLLPWLRAHHALGRRVLVGDAGRVPLGGGLEVLAEYRAPFDGDPRGTTLWTVRVLTLPAR